MFHQKNTLLHYAKSHLKTHATQVTTSLYNQRIKTPASKGQLMRDYIHESLYEPKIGFFNHEHVITPVQPLDFGTFKTPNDFINEYQRLTDTSEEFLTPVELFQPYYNQIVGRYITREIRTQNMLLQSDEPIYIYEIGAGRGTMALNMLDHFKEHEPEIYSRLQYRIIEISESLAKLQQERLGKSHPGKCRVHHKSIFEWDELVPSRNVFVVLMEVLDNLPHDKVRISQTPFLRKERIVGEGRVYVRGVSIYEKYSDIFRDPIIQRYLHYIKDYPLSELDFSVFFNNPYRFGKMVVKSLRKFRYIPTMQMRLLEILNKYIPHHQLIVADFDELPDNNDVRSWNGPTVQRRELLRDGTYGVKSFQYVIQPDKYTCDIFFGTDFKQMQMLYQRVRQTMNVQENGGRGAGGVGAVSAASPQQQQGVQQQITNTPPYDIEYEILKHSDFITKYDDKNIHAATQITPKYNPLVHEFKNQAFFLTRRRGVGQAIVQEEVKESWLRNLWRRSFG